MKISLKILFLIYRHGSTLATNLKFEKEYAFFVWNVSRHKPFDKMSWGVPGKVMMTISD